MRKLIVSALTMLGVAALSSPAQAVVPGANGRIVFTRAVCTSTCSSWSIVTADPNGTNEKVVAGPYPQSAFDEHFIANWSPDGTKLTFMANQGIWTGNADGSGLQDMFQAPAGTGVDDGPAFTPDGKHIVFTRCCVTGYGYSLWMINADGGGLKDVTKEPVVNGDGPADTTPQVSPDGKTIVFNRCFPNAPCEVATVSINGTNLHDLTDNTQFLSEHPNWSPDGKKIVFEMDPLTEGSPNIATINPDGSDLTQLTFSNDRQSGSLQPAYSPNGTEIIFSRFRSTGGTDLFTMNPDGNDISQITSTHSLELDPAWAVGG
jgi:Tol biopolymer transport system component